MLNNKQKGKIMTYSIRKFLNWGLSVALIASVVTACSGDEKKESKSMEQIQKEEGLPVVVENIQPRSFTKYLTFFGKFKGERETTVGAMIGGRIEKINFRPGDYVKENDVIIQFPEDAPASQYQQAKSAFELSQKTYDRMKALFEKGEISAAQFDGVETKYNVDKRNYETMKDMLQLDAPYDGTITELMVHEGDNVKAKAALFTIVKMNKMKIRVWLSDKERMTVKKGMKAIASFNGKDHAGTVHELSLSVNPRKNAFYADLIFDNSSREILAGTTADVKIIIYNNENAIVLPRNLVKTDGAEKFVYLAQNGIAKKQIVTVSNETGMSYEISSGVEIGDQLIVKGVERLSDGAKIKVVN